MVDTPDARSAARVRWIGCTLTALVALVAVAWLASAVSMIVAFALRYPAFDQYRLYRIYLELPFPLSAIQLENGHRPILPALVRLAEVRGFDADQRLQLAVGGALVAAAFLTLAATIISERGLVVVQKSAAILATVLAFFWLGNARILMHGNELVHVYAVVLASALIPVFVWASRNSRGSASIIAATACAIFATFSFGTGIACFAEIFALLIIIGARPAHFAIPVATAVCTALVYLLLPGRIDSGGFHDLARIALRWTELVASPWMNAWLATGTDALNPSFAPALAVSPAGRVVLQTARAIAAPIGEPAIFRESAAIGVLGIVGWLSIVTHAWRRRSSLGRLRLLAFGLSTFALSVAALMSLARAAQFDIVPSQVFADRYLPWSCLFWLGLALYVGCRPPVRSRSGFAFGLAALACAVLLMPTHRAFANWMATVHRSVQASAAAAELGLFDPQVFPDNADATRADVIASLDLLRTRHLSMFAEPDYIAVSAHRRIAPAPEIEGAVAPEERVVEGTTNATTFAFGGFIPHAKAYADAMLLAVDEQRAVRGLAKFSGYRSEGRQFFPLRAKNAFTGYVVGARPGERFSLVLVDPVTNASLAELPIVRAAPR